MIKLFTLLATPITAIFTWQYKQLDALRPDDTPMQVCALFALLILFEIAIVGLAMYFFGDDIVSLVRMLEYSGEAE